MVYMTTGVAKGGGDKGAIAPPCWSASKKKKEKGNTRKKEREKGKCFPETNSLGKEWKKKKSNKFFKEKDLGSGLCHYINYP